MRAIVSICAVTVTAIAVYFFVQDRIDRTGYKSEAQLRYERVQGYLAEPIENQHKLSKGEKARRLKDFQDELKRMRGN